MFDFFTQYQEHGPDYIAAYLQGYKDPPKGFTMPASGHYNEYFPGHVDGDAAAAGEGPRHL